MLDERIIFSLSLQSRQRHRLHSPRHSTSHGWSCLIWFKNWIWGLKLPPWITVRAWDVSSEAWGDGSLCDSWRRGEDRTARVILACQIVMEGWYATTPTSNAPSPLVPWPYMRCPHLLGLFKPSPNQLSSVVLMCRSLGITYLGGDVQGRLLSLTTAWEEQVSNW